MTRRRPQTAAQSTRNRRDGTRLALQSGGALSPITVILVVLYAPLWEGLHSFEGIVNRTKSLGSAGAKVIVPARDHLKAATALADLDGVEIEPMDLLDPACGF
jgi:hypothetical protein